MCFQGSISESLIYPLQCICAATVLTLPYPKSNVPTLSGSPALPTALPAATVNLQVSSYSYSYYISLCQRLLRFDGQTVLSYRGNTKKGLQSFCLEHIVQYIHTCTYIRVRFIMLPRRWGDTIRTVSADKPTTPQERRCSSGGSGARVSFRNPGLFY